MTDPIYGDNPVDPDLTWALTMRPPLINDAEMTAWRNVVVGAALEILESSWLVRWRVGSPITAEGVHLDQLGLELGFPKPAGWSEDRYRNAVIPIDGAAFSNRSPAATEALAAGLVDGAQTWLLDRPAALHYVVYFFSVSDDEAQTYRTVLEYGRPKGVGFTLVYSNVPMAGTFVLDVSLLDGVDILGNSL